MNNFALIEDLNAKNTTIIYSEKQSLVENLNNKINAKTLFNCSSINVSEQLGQVFIMDVVEVDVKDSTFYENEYDLYNFTSATVYNDEIISSVSANVTDKNPLQTSYESLAALVAASHKKELYDNAVSDLYYTSCLINSDSALVTQMIASKMKACLEPTSVNVFHVKEKLILEDFSTMVTYGVSEGINTRTNFNVASINVESNIPINTGTLSGGGDLKNLTIQMQIGSFYQMQLDFEGVSVKEVTGLPVGLEYIKSENCIKGSPKSAGKYLLKIIFENDTFIPGFLDIPILNRKW